MCSIGKLSEKGYITVEILHFLGHLFGIAGVVAPIFWVLHRIPAAERD